MKKMSKLLWIALAVVMLMSFTAVGASAAVVEETDVIVFNEGDDFEAVMAIALEEAEAGNTVSIKLNADVTFAESITLGETKESHAGLVKIESEMDGETPLYGIQISKLAIVNIYGNVSFDNIKLDGYVPEGASTSWTTGGCF